MHNYRAVSASLGSMHVNVPGGIVAELFPVTFPVFVGEGIHQDSICVPVAPDAFALAVFPETFACHLSAHAVWVEAAGFLDVPG